MQLLATAIFVFGVAASSAVDECFIVGQCLDSQVMSGSFTSDEYGCHELCQQKPGCRYFTFSPQLGYCELLLNCNHIDSSVCHECLTASSTCSMKEPQCWIQGECAGIPDHFESATSKEKCLDICKSTQGCQWFTFKEPSSLCSLFRDCPSVDDSCLGCISRERRCKQSSKGFSKLLVTSRQKISVLNLDETQPNLVCDDLPAFPRSTLGSIGQLFKGHTPIICGGVFHCDCYALTDGEWTIIDSLNTCRHYASSALLSLQTGETKGEHLVVLGGTTAPADVISSIEVFDGSTWLQDIMADRPKEQTQFCTVRIDDTNLITLGGVSGPATETFFYNSVENKWTQGPNLMKQRNGLACGILNWLNPDTGAKEQVVVAASGDYLSDSELLFLKDFFESGAGWVQGPALPAEAYSGSMVEYEDSVILVGGSEGVDGYHLYKLDSPFGSWVEMKQTLKEKHDRGVAFLVPDDLVSCYDANQ